ncbi:regucalcin [Lingula anatina]|uniref:Regucalcin n=1 Tax=Lingula anatina TaxID=7574 RepID=A0A1S3IPA5_LINAN|nr:regucalcin [Lingula anatina]|eukprot:XP_013399374.1 regucalcin [Lingula anatina]
MSVGTVSVALKNAAKTIGEGPHWDDKNQTLYYVDILSGVVASWKPATGEESQIKLDNPLSLVVPSTKGDFIVSLGRKLVRLDWEKQEVTSVLAEVDQGTKNRFNDGKCDPSGRLWAGTMGYETVPAQPERQMGSLFSLSTGCTLAKHVDKIDISNGLAWSNDNTIMYYIDSVPRKVYAFDFDINAGAISNQRTAIDFNTQPEGGLKEHGFPDGMCIDVEGKLWVACYKAGKVVRFDPVTAKQIQEVTFPAERITSCCFGGPNLDELYVTSGVQGCTEEELKNEQALAGSVFKVTGLGVKGTPCQNFQG